MIARFCFLCCFIFMVMMPQGVWAKRALTQQEKERLVKVSDLLKDVKSISLEKLVQELEASSHPRLNLSMKEAMAQAFRDIVKEQDVKGLKKKEWLFSMIALNMAYLQFVGLKYRDPRADPVNQLIRSKLLLHLPKGIDEEPGFSVSVE